MRVAIIGAGVYGTLAATALTEASVSTTLITRAERQKQLIGARTKITSPFGRFTAPLLALTPEEAQGGPFDVVIISTRADAFNRGAEIARSVAAPGGMVVSLVDSVGHLAGLVDRVPGCLVAAAHLDVRCSMDADGVLRQSGPPGRMRLGLMADTGADRLEALCSALDGRRFSARPESDTLLAEMWARHIFIAAAVGASIRAGGVPFRDALRFHSRRPFEKMMDEGVRIGAAHGVNRVFDAVRGLMFYADPLAGLIELRRALKPGSRAAVLVFSGPAQNSLIVEQLTIAARHAGIAASDPSRPGGLLSLGDPAQLTGSFARAGFADIKCRAIAAPMTLPSARDYVDFLRTAAGPVVQIASRLSDPERAALWSDLEQAFARYQTSDGWCGPNELLLVSGKASVRWDV